LVASLSNSLGLPDDEMSLAKEYFEILSKCGITGKIDEDGDVVFKQILGGKLLTFFISIHENDREYLHIVLPDVWSLGSDTEMAVALQACGKATRECKAVKLHVQPRERVISASIEMLVRKPDELEHFLPHIMGMFEHAVMKVKTLMATLMVLQNE